MKKSLSILLFSLLLSGSLFAAGDITYPKMDDDFRDLKISEHFSIEGNRNLINFYQSKLNDEDFSNDQKEFLKYGLTLLSEKTNDYNYFLAKRILYTVISQNFEGRRIKLLEGLSLAKKFITKIPFQNIDYSNVSEIGDDHFAWKTLKNIKESSNIDSWEKIERWANDGLTNYLKNKYKDNSINYDLNEVRNVFFIKKIKDTATSPKVNVVDAWDIKWKMKWGNEVHSEPVSNRLYVYSGGKFQDLVYSYNYQDDLMLILDKKSNESNDDNCSSVSEIKKLIKCLKLPPYRFDLAPYIKSSGVITEKNINEVIKKLVKSKVTKYQKENLLGRDYIIFKEASVEFRDENIMVRGGPVALSTVGAINDKYLRSNLLFNIWIDNYDNKDENAKSVILKNFENMNETYIEFFHDLGAAFGKEAVPASINSIDIGDNFLRKSLSGDVLLYDHLLLYRPKAWEHASATDLYWMAQYLNQLTLEKIKKSVAATKWPQFAQDVFVYRLQKRLYQILYFYKLKTKKELDSISAPNISIPLKTDSEIYQFAKTYSLPFSLVLNEMKRLNIDNHNYVDQVVVDGKLNSCKKSFVITLLEKHLYPSGIERRFNRRNDDVPLPECNFNK